jgi:glutamate dehydrogenase (NAD(P)+)
MLIAWSKVKDKYDENTDITWRDAAYMVAIERLNDAYAERGHWP